MRERVCKGRLDGIQPAVAVRGAFAAIGLIGVISTALPSQARAERIYTRDVVGNICRPTADALVEMGQAASYFADRYILGKGEKSFTDETFTYCKIILKFKGPKIAFNANWEADLATAERQRSVAIASILGERCSKLGGSLSKAKYQTRAYTTGSASFCEGNGIVHFMYSEYGDGGGMHRLNIAEPKVPGGDGGKDYYAFLTTYGYVTAEAKKTAQAEAEFAAALSAQRRADAIRLNWERPIKSQIGTRICRMDRDIQYIGFVEQVSPDNGKIQIRIADAHYVAHSSVRPGGFAPSVIWANPDAWDLCE